MQNVDNLLHLSQRWTQELKAEDAKHRDYLRREERKRIETGQPRQSLNEVTAYVQDWQSKLLASQPHYEVHSALGIALLDPARLAATHADLNDVH